MIVGVMQPYFFPYIGYWQLINAVDVYVLFDDVNFINRGWIHRNRILINGEPAYINVPMLGASQNKKICEIEVDSDERHIKANLSKLQSAYGRAPYFHAAFPLIDDAIRYKSKNLADYNAYALKKVCEYLSIDTKIVMSSEIEKDNSLKAQDKILDICGRLGADKYINAIGGKELYSHDAFDAAGIKLHFLLTDDIRYDQFGGAFVPNLSMIDIMMFNSPEEIREMLTKCSLVDWGILAVYEREEKIIIYGVLPKRLRFRISNFLSDECEIVGITDSYKERDTVQEDEFLSPKLLPDIEFDYVVVAGKDHEVEIYEALLNMGIDEKKIVIPSILLHDDFYYVTDLKKSVESDMVDADTVSMGLSYSMRGIDLITCMVAKK